MPLTAIEQIMTRRFPEVWEQARLTEQHFDASVPDTEARSIGPQDRHDDLARLTDEEIADELAELGRRREIVAAR